MILRRISEAIRRQDWAVVVIELIVVVVGLFIGLQVDSWNEQRKESEAFTEVLERVYTDLVKERYQNRRDFQELGFQRALIQAMLEDPDSISDETLVPNLYYLDLPRNWYILSAAGAAIRQQTDLLAANANTPQQVLVAKHLVDYGAQNQAYQATPERVNISSGNKDTVTPFLREAEIADPVMVWQLSSLNAFTGGPNGEFVSPPADIAAARDLLTHERFQTALQSLRTKKRVLQNFVYNQSIATDSVIKRVKSEYPALRLLFQEAEIIGTAVDPEDELWNDSFVPMERLAGHENRWVLDIELHNGELKFRTRNNWDENWGGPDFPAGELSWFGNNIEVEAGHYRIVLDLAEGTYAFDRLGD